MRLQKTFSSQQTNFAVKLTSVGRKKAQNNLFFRWKNKFIINFPVQSFLELFITQSIYLIYAYYKYPVCSFSMFLGKQSVTNLRR